MERRNFVTRILMAIPTLFFSNWVFGQKEKVENAPKKGFIVRADESRYFGKQSTPKDILAHCKISSADTDENMLIQISTPKFGKFKGGPAPHYHDFENETVYVISGEFVVHLDGEDFTLKTGETAFIPKGTLHTVTNPIENNPGQILVIFQPAPKKVEDFFQYLSTTGEFPMHISPEGWH